ncbi:uncharacterized protein RHOBADRAFT_45631 [Rhodotorula graminis WP1]|uniref:Small EDRK-rich factor-like N-terminal domain-containing protein n=1 Tax=Rhodotorula graminis (strain WP1) TaxID=578459 RepID=A0A0P9H160_RHOGW|nr:uncharacterized protein RHOBADRAFT_45631 [Rhodotorula graminis WP1]KPV73672.1 hypothetical protein RHOBADRAFT_45631 [Rhodotorula graminis WP1]
MARGNQRDKAREKAAKLKADATKGQRKDDGKSFRQRQEDDAEKMRQKQAAALAKKEADAKAK